MRWPVALILAAAAPLAAAADINTLGVLSQSEFRLLAEDLGAALSYKALAPAEPLGVTGFDIGVEATATALEHADLLDKASSGSPASMLVVPKLHLHKGLPWGVDVGASYGAAPASNVRVTGLELRVALLEGGVATPAIAMRGTYSTLSGVSQLGLDTYGVELTISKGLALFTPYGGVGQVWVNAKPSGVGLSDEKFSLTKYYVGGNLNFGLLNLAAEVDRTGGATSYGVKLGWRF